MIQMRNQNLHEYSLPVYMNSQLCESFFFVKVEEDNSGLGIIIEPKKPLHPNEQRPKSYIKGEKFAYKF